MGYGTFDEATYHSHTTSRRASNTDDFEYSKHAKTIHPSLDPMRIHKKPFGLLESRDSVDHPISMPIIVTFDVTGSNINNARVAQQKLPGLMSKLEAVCENPQVAIWANDDINSVGVNAIQLGDFESNNLIDEAIRNTWLVGEGGGNDGESYDLLLYAAARKTITDSFEVRGKKGYMFLYADEPFFQKVKAKDVKAVFGDSPQVDIPIGDMIAEVKEKWNVYVIWPQRGYGHSRRQFEELFGEDFVETLQDPSLLCDKIASIVAAHEAQEKEIGQLAVANTDLTNRVE